MKAKLYPLFIALCALFITATSVAQVSVTFTATSVATSCDTLKYIVSITDTGKSFKIANNFNYPANIIAVSGATNIGLGTNDTLVVTAFSGTQTCTLHVKLACSSIPSGGNTGAFSDTVRIAAGTGGLTYKINNQPVNTSVVVDTGFTYPQIDNAAPTNISIGISPCGATTLTANYTNGGGANFKGAVVLHNFLKTNCSAYQISAIRVFTNGTNMYTKNNPFSTTDTVQISFKNTPVNANAGTLKVEYDITQNCIANGCISSGAGVFPLLTNCGGSCNGLIDTLRWGCSVQDLCRVTTKTINISNHIPDTATAQLRLTRITPNPPTNNPGIVGVWDATCSGTETEWQYLIEYNNTSGSACAKARNIVVSLYNNYLSGNTYTHIVAGSVNITTANNLLGVNGLFADSLPTSLIVNGNTIANPYLDTVNNSIVQSCFTAGEQAAKNYVVRIPEMLPGQRFILRFVTRRCCASGSPFNTGINYNRWQLSVSGQDYCGNALPLQTNGYTHNPGSNQVVLHKPFVFQNNSNVYNAIGNNLNESGQYPELQLVQSINQPTFILVGGHGTCGAYTPFEILNQQFPNTLLNSYNFDSELYTACGGPVADANAIGGVAGANPRGLFTIKFNLPAGVEIANPHFGGITNWVGSYNPATATAVFDLATMNFATSDDFRKYLLNAALQWEMRFCCGNGVTGGPANFNIQTYFTPLACGADTSTCNCRIPLSEVPITLQLICPGCITPGMALEDFKIYRTSFGYPDSANARIADNTGQITSSYSKFSLLNRTASIAGDTLQSIAEGYFQPGDNATGFTYPAWQSYWQSVNGTAPVLHYLYFEQQIQNANKVNLQVLGNTEVVLLRKNGSGVYVPLFSTTINANSWNVSDAGNQRRMTCKVRDTDFGSGVVFLEEDRFTFTTNYRVCQNPDTTNASGTKATPMAANAYLYLSIDTFTTAHPYAAGTLHAGDHYEAATDTLNPIPTPHAQFVSPNGNYLFFCQANQSAHTVHNVTQRSQEFWDTDQRCDNTGYLIYKSYINADYPNVFKYEVRTLPDAANPIHGPLINIGALSGKAVNFSIKRPVGFQLSLTSIHTRAPGWLNPVQPTTLQSVLYPGTGGLILPASQAAGTKADFRIDTTQVNFTIPRPGLGLLLNPVASPVVSQTFSLNGKNGMLLGDEEFYEAAVFALRAVCATNATDTGIGKIYATDNTITAPRIKHTCVADSNLVLSTTGTNYTVPIPNPNLSATAGTPAINGQYANFPFTITVPPNAIDNLIIYIDVPGTVYPDCLSSAQNCSGTVYSGTTNLPGGWKRYTIGALSAGSYSFWLRTLYNDCTNLGTNTGFNTYYSWDCDGIADTLPPLPTMCTAPDTIHFSYTKPGINVTINATNPTTFTGCSPTTYTACISSTLLGGIGNITASFNFGNTPGLNLSTISNATVTLNGQNPQAVQHSLSGQWATFHLNANGSNLLSTLHPTPAPYLGGDGLNGSDGPYCVQFTVTPNCNTTTIGTVPVRFYYQRYCDVLSANPATDSISATIAGRNIALTTPGLSDGCVILPLMQLSGQCITPIISVLPDTAKNYAWAVPTGQTAPCPNPQSCTVTSYTPQIPGSYAVTVTYNGSPACTRTATLTNGNNPAFGIPVGSGVGLPTVSSAMAAQQLLPLTGTANANNKAQFIRIIGSLAVDTNYIFKDTSSIFCMAGAEIIVNAGKTLTLSGNTSTRRVILQGCDTLWRGIRLMDSVSTTGQQKSAINSIYTTIRDAQYGIRLGNYSNMNITNTSFQQCFVGIYFNPDSTPTPREIIPTNTFYENDFRCVTTAGLLKRPYINMQNDTEQPNVAAMDTVKRTWAGIHLVNLKQMTVGVKTATLINTFVELENGIVMSGGDLTVVNSSFSKIGTTYTGSGNKYYGGLLDGTCIRSFSPDSVSYSYMPRTHTLTVRGMTKLNSNTAVNIKRIVYSEGLNVNIDSVYADNVFTGFEVRNTPHAVIKIGIGFTVPANKLSKVKNRGIWLVNNDPAIRTLVQYNEIEVDGSGQTPDSIIGRGIEVIENMNPAHGSEYYEYNKITLNNNALFGILLQNCHGANNYTSLGLFSVLNNTVILNTTSATTKNRCAIRIQNCDSITVMRNSVIGSSATLSFTNGGIRYPIGYDCINSGNVYMNCNQSQTIYTGYRFSDSNNNLTFSANRIGNGSGTMGNWGVRVENGATINPQLHRGNQWLGAYNGSAAWNGNSSNVVSTQQFTVHQNTGSLWPPSINPASGWFAYDPQSGGFIPDTCYGIFNGYGAGYKTDETVEQVLDDLDNAIIADTLDFGDYHEPLQWQNEKKVLDKIESNLNFITTNEVAQFYNDKSSGNIGTLLTTEQQSAYALSIDENTTHVLLQLHDTKDSLRQLLLANDAQLDTNATLQQVQQWQVRYKELTAAVNQTTEQLKAVFANALQHTTTKIEQAQATNSTIAANSETEEWHKQVNNVYLNTIAKGVYTFNESQWNTISSIAFKCPLVGGEAVYRARGMYASVKDTLYDDQQLCALAGVYYKKEPAKQNPNLNQQVVSFKLNPNPAADYTSLSCNQVISGEWQLKITDYAGRDLITETVVFSSKQLRIATDMLSSGTYLLRLSQNGVTSFIGKLNISK